MIALGVDTASAKKDRGYALAENGVVLWTGSKPPDQLGGAPPIDWVVGELPWQGVGPDGRVKTKLRGARFITFCVNNGFQLRDASRDLSQAPQGYAILPVPVWKDKALFGCARMQGDAYCRNLQQKYMPKVADHNQLDAGGIAIAGSLMTLKELKSFQPTGFKR